MQGYHRKTSYAEDRKILDDARAEGRDIPLDDFLNFFGGKDEPLAIKQIEQLQTMQQTLTYLFHGYDQQLHAKDPCRAHVVSLHYVRGIALPVVEFTLPCKRGKIILRDNFRDAKISFELERPLPENTFGIVGFVDPKYKTDYTMCEGFPKSRVHGSFAENSAFFTMTSKPLSSDFPQEVICQVGHILCTMPDPPSIKLMKKMKIQRRP